MSRVDGTVARAPEPADDEAALKALHDAEFASFAESTYRTVEGILQASCRDRDMVYNALADAYLLGRAKWFHIRTYDNPIAWVITVARFKLLREQDQQRTRVRREAAAAQEFPPVPRGVPGDAFEAQEQLWAWLQNLRPRQVEVFKMTRLGFTNAEIARTLGVGDWSVRSYKAAALKRLRELAEEDGYGGDDREPR